MTTFDDLQAWRQERLRQSRAGLTLGFVPTMGALHEGHLALVRRSLGENDGTLVSIFVNPTQFDASGDLEAYPRTLEADCDLLRAAGVNALLVPRAAQLYSDGYRYRAIETERSRELEGACRPGHFDGVLTVVLKLLQIAAAERAYFGEKDWQQLTLIRGLVEAFFVPTAIVACPTVRAADGLALSSRNARLSESDRLKAATFYRALSSSSTTEATRRMQAEGFSVDYVEERDERRLGAVRLGGVRLIDNVPVGSDR